MRKLEKEEAQEAEAAQKERASKRQKGEDVEAEESDDDNDGVDVQIEAESDDDMMDDEDDDEDDAEDEKSTKKARKSSPVPKHETQQEENDLTKASRTVFLGNVSTSAITSKSARRVFIAHLTSFFPEVQKKHPDVKLKLESIRFRSTPYACLLYTSPSPRDS